MTFTRFPYPFGAVSRVVPLTYRTGASVLEILEELAKYIDEELREAFNTALSTAEADYREGLTNAEQYVDAAIQFINNKTGQAQTVRVTLDAPYLLEIDPLWPNNHPIDIVLTQNHIGGYPITLGENITGTLDVNLDADGRTELTLIPQGDGTWEVFQLDALLAALSVELEALGETLAGQGERLTTAENTLTATNAAVSALNTDKLGRVYDHAGLVAAVAAGGTVVCDPAATITLNAPIALTKPVVITGGRFTIPAGSLGAFLIQSDNVTIEKSTFTGAGTAQEPNRDQLFINATGTTATVYNNIVIRDNHMAGSLGGNVWLRYCENVVISGNHIHDYLYSGITLLSNNGFHISDNTIHDAPLKAPIVNTYGIALTDDTNTVAGRTRNGTVVGNTVRNMPWEGIDTHGGDSITIANNVLINCARGIALVMGNATRLIPPININVTGNFIDMSGGVGNAVALFGRSGIPSDAVITGNTVVNYVNENPIYTEAYDRVKTYVGGNNVPWISWRAITMTDGWDVAPDPTTEPQFMVDGKTLHVRGQVRPPGGVPKVGGSLVGTVATGYAPSRLSYFGQLKGTNSAAGTFSLAIQTDGKMVCFYPEGDDTVYFYPLSGTVKI